MYLINENILLKFKMYDKNEAILEDMVSRHSMSDQMVNSLWDPFAEIKYKNFDSFNHYFALIV